MSDEEEVVASEEEEEEDESEEMPPPEDTGPSEAQVAMQRRQAAKQISSEGLDEAAKELLEANAIEREAMEQEIQELRQRNERRKKEREAEEKRLLEIRQEEDRRRKAEEEERKRKKEEEERKKKDARLEKFAEIEKRKNPPKANFVIAKREGAVVEAEEEEEDEEGKERKSKDQLEAEKKAILAQRVPQLAIDGFDDAKLKDKAKELYNQWYRLESEKYDLEKRWKTQQYDMMDLAEKARNMNKTGRDGLKRVQMGPDEQDSVQEKYSSTPAKIVMYSQFERQKDKRQYGDRKTLFTGPQYLYAAEKISPQRIVKWGDDGLPIYEEVEGMGGGEGEAAPVEGEE